jgi:catechol 2,3-dioxygenase-like lactoylglutathione lyase family enzyme
VKLGMIVVLTPDLIEARRFYGHLLGLTLVRDSTSQLIFDLAGTEFHVFGCTGAAPAGSRHGATAATVCAFEVASVEAEMSRLGALGVVFLHGRPAENALSGIRYAAFEAPGGNVHELVERITA